MIGKLVNTDCLRLEQESDLNNIIETVYYVDSKSACKGYALQQVRL